MKLPTFFNRATAPVPRESGIAGFFNRAITAASMVMHVKMANRWRDQWNPLRGLTIARAIAYLEAGERGELADLQWLYRYIEMTDPTLCALLARYDGGLVKLDWQIKTVPEDEWPDGASEQLAEDQARALRELYDGIDNLREAIQFLVLARFRGYSHLEKHITNDGDVVHLEPVPQWHWVRDGLNGAWQYNKEARGGTYKGEDVDPERLIVREVQRPVNRIALIQFVLRNLGIKDWAGFIEIYGVPPIFLIGPPNVAKGDEGTYQEVAEKIIGDSRGYLPNGSDVKSVESGQRGTNPFRDFISYLKEELVLAATGGKLTMLAESGSGTLAGGAHQEAWDEIIESEAMLISEQFQRDLDKPYLQKKFGEEKPILAYLELCAYDEDEPSEVVDHVQKLDSAGYEVDAEQVAEKTGYKVTRKPAADPNAQCDPSSPSPDGPTGRSEGRGEGGPANSPFRNRNAYAAAVAPTLEFVRSRINERLAAILALDDAELMQIRLNDLKADILRWSAALKLDPPGVDQLNQQLATGWANGMAEASREGAKGAKG